MKKFIYLIMFFGALSCFSQKSGFKGGLNIGNERVTQDGNSATATAKLSFMLGLYTEAKLSDQLFFSPELVYSVDGGKAEGFGDSFKDNFSYLSVPFLLKYYTSENFNLHAGPQLGFLLSAKVKSSSGTADISSALKKTNFSIAFGGEGNVAGSFDLGMRVILGLTNIADDPGFGDAEYFLNTIQIYAAIPFN